MSIDKLKQEENVTVSWSFFPLHPETPAQGLALSELFRGREGRLQGFLEQIKAVAAREGLAYGERTMTYNSRLAQELGAWADSIDQNTQLHNILYQAYFVHNKDISNIDILVSLAIEAGLNGMDAENVLKARTFSQQVDEDWQRARNMGITGVPTFASADLVVVGCQSYDILMRFLEHLRKLKAEAIQT